MRHLSGVLIDFIMFQIPCLELGSKPEDGSSRKTILDFPIKAFAKDSFLLFPPDKFLTYFPFSLIKLHYLIISYMLFYKF